jgi:[acyl-carrier-protein] S-malonyltransferase
LGEYTALYASGRLSFSDALRLVDFRGQFMNDACEKVKGTMAVIMGMDPHVVEQLVKEANLPNDLWIANYNCPGQIVISGTLFGVEKGSQMAKERGAKRIIPLQVHGAFHSGLMNEAGIRLSPYIDDTTIMQGFSQIVMNVPGDFVETEEKVRQSLVDQVTHSVRWEQGIRKIKEEDISCFIEFGPGTTLSGMNKKIGVQQPTISIQKVTDLQGLEIC